MSFTVEEISAAEEDGVSQRDLARISDEDFQVGLRVALTSLITILEGEGNVRDTDYGLCNHLNNIVGDNVVYEFVCVYSASWEHTTGWMSSPVPHDRNYGFYEGVNRELRLSLAKHLLKRIS